MELDNVENAFRFEFVTSKINVILCFVDILFETNFLYLYALLFNDHLLKLKTIREVVHQWIV